MLIVDRLLPTPTRVLAAAVVVGSFAGVGMGVRAAVTSVDTSATASVQAERIEPEPADVAVVFDAGDVDREVVEDAVEAAARAGAVAAPGRTGSLGMRRITRGGTTVHAPPSGYLIPMVYVALPRGASAGVLGADVSSVLGDGVVMNELTASITGAAVGDVIQMQSADGSPVDLPINGIRPYEQLGGSELAMSTDTAARLGATADTRVVIWGIRDRERLDVELTRVGLTTRDDTKVNRSWDPPDPDDTLSTARTKDVLGEPWYRFESDGSISMHPTWRATNLTGGRELLNDTIPISARCHVEVIDDLRAALAEAADSGLADAFDVDNANAYGGCYGPRFSRQSGQIGFLSRHSYGMAIDTNTTSNCQGCVPTMDCRVVRIFRKHGFAWGGNFRTPDGMHFEWVGERRDQIPFASNYCPNLVQPLAESAPSGAVGLEVLTIGSDSIAADHSHAP